MSWFCYGAQRSSKKRKGIWLRVAPGFNKDVHAVIKKVGLLRKTDSVQRIVVQELQGDKVYLQIWATSIFDAFRGKRRYNVFNIVMDENSDWVCEGDLGRGLSK